MSIAPNPPDLVELYVDQRLSLAAIGARCGHTADWVRARLVAAGVPPRPPRRQPTISDADVWSRLNQGLRVPEIVLRAQCAERRPLGSEGGCAEKAAVHR